MPTNIPGSSASFPANVVAPVDGDARNAASIQTPLTNLADRTAWLKGRVDRAGSVLSFGNSDLGASSSYLSIGYSPDPSDLAVVKRIVVPANGRLSNLRVHAVYSHAGAGSTMQFKTIVSSTESALTCQASAGQSTASDTTHSVAVSAGDVISVLVEVSGTITTSAKQVSVSMMLTFD